ncbi:hypothetical protein MtrunA17_Chr2g0313631 [Medicago truncatula]|uniref:Uncharacterized protein n=1 Tax=Medicago truncatula TaxID=3880 RepID=I3SG28_MEDTR|nr:unknown [Medicago truncatula]RHN74745.1 hypothetical protein MtrunA17_Chr2g0313631 [Medicago truncatula]
MFARHTNFFTRPFRGECLLRLLVDHSGVGWHIVNHIHIGFGGTNIANLIHIGFGGANVTWSNGL